MKGREGVLLLRAILYKCDVTNLVSPVYKGGGGQKVPKSCNVLCARRLMLHVNGGWVLKMSWRSREVFESIVCYYETAGNRQNLATRQALTYLVAGRQQAGQYWAGSPAESRPSPCAACGQATLGCSWRKGLPHRWRAGVAAREASAFPLWLALSSLAPWWFTTTTSTRKGTTTVPKSSTTEGYPRPGKTFIAL